MFIKQDDPMLKKKLKPNFKYLGPKFGKQMKFIANAANNASVSDIKSDIFNISDDMPAPPQDVVEFAARLLNTDPPEPVIFSEAILSEMARSFYSETKYIINQKIKEKLGLELKYPNYKLGLKDILKEELNR